MSALGDAAWRALSRDAAPLSQARLRELSPFAVLAPHPDDETLGCGGLLARAADLGLRPRVAFLTDGSGSHRGSPTWSPKRLAGERRREAGRALKVLGVGGEDVAFLEWPDAAPLRAGSAAVSAEVARLSDWLRGFGARALWTPWRGEAHCDHEAAADLGAAAAGVLGIARFDYLVWGWSDPRLVERLAGSARWSLACADLSGRRARALAAHRTQTTALIDDAEESFRVRPELAALTTRPAELFFEAA